MQAKPKAKNKRVVWPIFAPWRLEDRGLPNLGRNFVLFYLQLGVVTWTYPLVACYSDSRIFGAPAQLKGENLGQADRPHA
jgi:hypothetical protein